MIRPEPLPDPQALRTAAHRYAGLAAALAEAGARTGGLAEQIARDWPDAHGREWAERAGRLRRELGREALAATELEEALARRARAVDQESPGPSSAIPTSPASPALPPVAGAGRSTRPGMRLGGTESRREDGDRGMRIAELPPATGPSG